MGRALVREPSVFLLDEPLSNLDAKLRVQVRAEIKDLQERTGTTMVYVTHDQVEAMTLGQRVAVLHEGVLQQIAPPAELYDHPANVFVAGFIGTPPMNLLPAVVSQDARGRATVRIAGGDLLLPEGETRAPVGARLTVGVRPEEITVATEGAKQAWAATVEHVENLGHESLVHLRLKAAEQDAPPLVARISGARPPAKGDRVGVDLDPNRLHLFQENGAAID
jgi:ABC-type sugar transport system ATPase subunit